MTIDELERLADKDGKLNLEVGVLDGNAYGIVGMLGIQARRQGWPEQDIQTVQQQIVGGIGPGHFLEGVSAVCNLPRPLHAHWPPPSDEGDERTSSTRQTDRAG